MIVSGHWGRPLAAFLDPDEAEAFLKQCVQVYRATRSPFASRLNPPTSLPEEFFHDWLLDLGLEPPLPAQDRQHACRRWEDWWEQIQPTLTEWQRSMIWQVMDENRPAYKVIEVACE